MRKILSEKEIEAKRKKNVLIMSIFMLGVLVFGTVGFAFLFGPGTSNTNVEKNVEGTVRPVGNQWALTLNNQNFFFSNSPDSVKNISVPVFLTIQNFAGSPLYIASENKAVTNEIVLTLGRFSSRVQEACYGPCEEDLPEKNCTENLIVWQDSSESNIYQEDKCIFIQGDLRTVDAFLYKIFGI